MRFTVRRANQEGKKRADGRYEIRITTTTISGAKKPKSFYGKTKKEAQSKARLFIHEYNRKTGSGITISQLAEEWEYSWAEKGLAPKTRSSYRDSLAHIVKLIGNEEVDALTLPDLMRTLKALSGSTHDHVRTALSVMLNFGRLHGYCQSNPLSGVKVPKKAENKHARCSVEELRSQLEHIYAEFHPFLLFLAHTGLRPWREAIVATKEDVARIADETYIIVGDSKTDAGTGRKVPITDRFLLDYIDSVETGTLFPSITYNAIRFAWQRAQKYTGVTATIYGLRSMAISKWSETESLDVVMHRAGHADVKTTLLIYNEVSTLRAVLGQRVKERVTVSNLIGDRTDFNAN